MQVPDLIPDMNGGLAAACAFSGLEDFMEDDFNQATRGDPLLSSSHQQHLDGQVTGDSNGHHHNGHHLNLHQHHRRLSQDRHYSQPSEEDEVSLSPESLDRMELSA